MSIKDKYSVKPIPYEQTKEWLLYKHYAKRMPPIMYSFGLYNENILEGVCTFGDCGGNPKLLELYKNILELNRLVINKNQQKNILSFFVSQCFRYLPKPVALISYADSNQNHIGYIYQATNWIYTGLSNNTIVWEKNGITYHNKTMYDKFGTNSRKKALNTGYKLIKKQGKHRYFQFLGTKKEKKEMLKNLKYEIKPYPKGDNKRYDASYQPSVQQTLI